MHQDRLKYLLDKYVTNLLSEQESEELDSWFNNLAGNKGELEKWIDEEGGKDRFVENLFESFKKKKLGIAKVRKISVATYISIAATVLIFAAFGTWFYMQNTLEENNGGQRIVSKPTHIEVIKPGTNKATLTLSSGKIIDLDKMPKGQTVKNDGLEITKTEDGQLLYQASETPTNFGYNTINVPKGGKYQVVLSDGTLVWLNAASSLKYPTHFSNNSRKVELTGEAYFEVAKDKKRPFIVANNEQIVTVLGTHFNINGYKDNGAIITTLLEGSVKVATKNNSQSNILKPGQQSSLTHQQINVSPADLDVAIAWKNGFFRFKDEGIYQIMTQIARWYNVEVVFEDKFTDKNFGAYISRDKNITEILNIMQATKGIRFKIEGRVVKVMK